MEPGRQVAVNELLTAGRDTAISLRTGLIPMGQAFRFERSSFSAAPDATTMAETVMQFSPATDAEALKLLRASFPDCPLSMRVAALDFLMRHKPRRRTGYIPR
jgi:hypothetical protein